MSNNIVPPPVFGEHGAGITRRSSEYSIEDEKDEKFVNEKSTVANVEAVDVEEYSGDLNATTADILEAIENSKLMSDEQVHEIIEQIVSDHQMDPNFPTHVYESCKLYLNPATQEDEVLRSRLWRELRIEAALYYYNSPYSEVRSVVSNKDDPSTPSMTFRVWTIGCVYVAIGAFINQFFSIRQPAIAVGASVAQLLSYPVGVAMAKFLPSASFSLMGRSFSMNPGPFSKKEHMLITIMANVGFSTPYTDYIIWTQVLTKFFNQSWARNTGYQLIIALSTNFMGYGMAGLTRQFLVYPQQNIFPASLVQIGLNNAFFSEVPSTIPGPFGKQWRASRMKCFVWCFTGMFFYFLFPNFIFPALSTFNWINWIAPDNAKLNSITGMNYGLGLTPFPTFDWNYVTAIYDPTVIPFYSTVNSFAGIAFTIPIVAAIWYNNIWFTSYLPINSNAVWANDGKRFNVSRVLDKRGIFDNDNYQTYSSAYLSAGNSVTYGFFFATYSASISYAILYHRHEIKGGFMNLLRRGKGRARNDDIHNRLMRAYPEVSEWYYFAVLAIAAGLGAAGVGAFETYTTPAVVLYGIAMCAIFVIPIGIIYSVTGIEVTLNVLAEFFGGLFFPGNALALNFFKSYGYVTCAHTLRFANDLKLAHYVHIPPMHTFMMQMIATFISTVVCVLVLGKIQVDIPNVCSTGQKDKFTCPGPTTFFTAAVLWGTLGPARIYGAGRIYSGLVWCFLAGFLLPYVSYYGAKYTKWTFFRRFHPVVFMAGALNGAPYNISYQFYTIPVGYISMVWLKTRHLSFWSRYNYVVSASFSAAIALSAILTFFILSYNGFEFPEWWGNSSDGGCEATGGCPRLVLEAGTYFGERRGQLI